VLSSALESPYLLLSHSIITHTITHNHNTNIHPSTSKSPSVSPTDFDAKTAYCRFAAELCRAPFLESYGHPVSAIGCAAYVCKDLGGHGSLGFILSEDSADVSSLCFALIEVAKVLEWNKLGVQALPVIVLLEHLHSIYTHRADLWLSARLLRVKVLVQCRLFAESASMLATIKHSLLSIANHTYGELLNSGTGPLLPVDTYDTSANGLDFHGMAPFFNHLPPSGENRAAVDWVHSLPSILRKFCGTSIEAGAGSIHFLTRKTIRVPIESELTEAGAGGGDGSNEQKGEKGEKGDKIFINKIIEKPLFGAPVLAEVTVLCASFLIQISMTDPGTGGKGDKGDNSSSIYLKEISEKGLELVRTLRGEGQGYFVCCMFRAMARTLLFCCHIPYLAVH